MQVPLQQKRLAWFALVAAAPLILLVIGSMMFDRFDKPPSITPKLHNVYQNSLVQEWEYLRGTLQMSDQSTLLDFYVDYQPSGEIKELNWQFGDEGSNGTFTTYRVWLPPGMTQYQISMTKQDHIWTGEFLNASEANHLLTPSLFKMITPHENAAYYRMQFVPQFVHSFQDLSNNPHPVREIKNGQITGSIKNGQGFLLNVFSFHQEGPGSYSAQSPNQFLLSYPQ